jgi:tRNA U34 2-thiouridine synthase MnmA/TrmU
MKKKAIALISGGLDSLLAAKVIQEQGIKVHGVTFIMSAASRDIRAFKKNVKDASKEAGIPVKIVDIAKEFLNVLKSPKHGYGAYINPCIDCKIFMLRKAKDMMEKEGASFIITGEVLGERPMSQRRDALNIIKKDSRLKGHLLRPLSAKLLEETIPEKEGLVDRSKLLNISGRSRKPQFALADKYGIKKYFTPAGGCLLTDPAFTKRLKDLIENEGLTIEGLALLKYGRHFRLDNKTKVVVGRDEKDNRDLLAIKESDDIILRLKGKSGPYVLLRGKKNKKSIEKAASLAVSHSKFKSEQKITVEYWTTKDKKEMIEAAPLRKSEIESLRI